MTGRGSWTPIGGTYPADIGGATYGFYQLMDPMVGSQVRGQARVDPDYKDFRAVWAGTKGLQTMLNREFDGHLTTDGTFGPATDAAVRVAQSAYGLVEGFTPGRIGPTLASRLFRSTVLFAEMKYQIPNHALAGILSLESDWDPGSVGEISSADGGLAQFHCDGSSTWWLKFVTLPEIVITHQLAFDPAWSINAAAMRLAFYRARYASKPAMVDVCSIASHNAPALADIWYQTGVPPTTAIAQYVTACQRRARAY